MDNSLKKNLSWNTIGMILYNLAIWVFSVLILRITGASESGYYAIASSLGNTFYAISLWGMRSFIVSDQKNRYTYREYVITRIVAVILSIVIMLVTAIVSSYSLEIVRVLIAYSMFKFAEALIELCDCLAQQKMVMDINAKSMVIRGVLYIILFYLSLVITKESYIAFSVITICSLLILYFYNYKNLCKFISFHETAKKENITDILKKCFPIMAFELLAAAIVAIPRLLYEKIGSYEDLGIYVSIYTMVVFLQLVINILIYTFAPYMAKAYQEKEMKEFKKYILFVVLGAVGLGLLAEILVYLIGEPVMTIIFGAVAGHKYHYLYLGIVSGVTLALTWLISQIFVILGKNNSQLVSAVISVIVCIIVSLVYIDGKDCNRMSIALIVSNISFVISSCLMMKNSRSVI